VASFKDKAGREWKIEVDYPAVEKVIADTGFDITNLADPNEASKLTGLKMLAVIVSLCCDQFAARKMSVDDFRKSINGDSMESAAAALEEELINFSPSRLHPTLKLMSQKGRELQAAATKKAHAMIEAIKPDQVLTGSPTPTDSPASSESTHPDDDSRSES
jgi:hypothetical protein